MVERHCDSAAVEGDVEETAIEEVAVPQVGDAALEVDDAAGRPERQRIDGILESVLFAAGTPVPLRRLVEILNGPPPKEVKAAIERLMREYGGRDRGIRLVAVAGGYQFRSAPENAEWVRAMLGERPARLGRATLETLSIIAYRQPTTRAEIEAIRGVDVDSALSSLLAKRLIKIAGRKETVGRPLIYATTPDFLETFGLNDLSELPVLKEIGPVPEPEDETPSEDGDEWRASAEDPEPGGDQLETSGGSADPGGPDIGERPDRDRAGDAGGSETGSNRD